MTANRTVARLASRGLVSTSPYRPIELTQSGKRLARTAKARHEVVLEFLISLGVPEAIATVDSEGIEHHCSPKTLDVMKHFTKSRNR